MKNSSTSTDCQYNENANYTSATVSQNMNLNKLSEMSKEELQIVAEAAISELNKKFHDFKLGDVATIRLGDNVTIHEIIPPKIITQYRVHFTGSAPYYTWLEKAENLKLNENMTDFKRIKTSRRNDQVFVSQSRPSYYYPFNRDGL